MEASDITPSESVFRLKSAIEEPLGKEGGT
jgi:hypothetical protein